MSAWAAGIRETRWQDWTVDVAVLTTGGQEALESAVSLVRRRMDEVARA